MPTSRPTRGSGNRPTDRHAATGPGPDRAGATATGGLRVAGLRVPHLTALVLGALVVAGLLVEPGGPPAGVEASDPVPLPEIPGGRAAGPGPWSDAAPPAPAAITSAAAAGGVADGTGARADATPAVAAGAPAERAAGGALEVDPVIDLGTVARGASVERTIRFRNRGSRPVSILAVRTTCGCTAAEPDRERYGPGESGSVRVVFTGRNAGAQTQVVRLVTDDPDRPVTSVRIRATVAGDSGVAGDVGASGDSAAPGDFGASRDSSAPGDSAPSND